MSKGRTNITGREIERLKSYLDRIEAIRKTNAEKNVDLPLGGKMPNWLAIEQAKDLSAWLNIYEYSTDNYWKSVAEQQLLSLVR